ncbi:MAG TPA: hypothetical protein VF950_12000 [Planctomycetota bacterium]
MWAAGILLVASAQSAPGVDDQKVAAAIERGVAWLRKAKSHGSDLSKKKLAPVRNADELILLTFLHSGVAPEDPKVQQLLASVLAAPLDKTYSVAVRAMALEELDRVRYQSHLARCALYLIDNQLVNGQWGYGDPSPAADAMAVDASPTGRPRGGKPLKKVAVRTTRVGTGTGDFSNSQYAALGLRACHDAGVVLPKETLTRAAQAWVVAQTAGPPPAGGTPSLPSGRKPRGWCYDHPCSSPAVHHPYGTMTAGGVGALAIYDHLLGRESKRNGPLLDGLAWLQVHYTVETVPGPIEWDGITKSTYVPYYLYALERAAILTGNEKLGAHVWYADGVQVLLQAQKADGSWWMDDWGTDTWDTCFALLFLKRATRPLVASVDRFKPAEVDK